MTVEMAAVLPLFLLFFLSLSVFFQTLHVQSRADLSLMQSAKEMAVLRYGTENTANEAAEMREPRGQGQEVSGEWISLTSRFRVKPLFSLIRGQQIQGRAFGGARAWIGGDGVTGGGASSGDVVYRTVHGTVYHTDLNCPYLQPSIRVCAREALPSRRNADGEIYRGCELCGGAQAVGSKVFITDTGNRYHIDLGCSGLKRMIYTVPKEEADGAFCSKCTGHSD